METITVIGLIIIGICMGFILTKGFQLNKEIKNKKIMSTLTINNEVKPTLPTQTYCFSGRWECDDSAHDCPEKCGYVRYKDEYGDILEESGFCKTSTNIQIVASEIIQVVGLNKKVCDQTPI